MTTAAWRNIARLVSVLCGMARSGYTVLVKIDGHRDASRRYTIVVNGEPDGSPLFRGDASSLAALLVEAVHACGLSLPTGRDADAKSGLAEAFRAADAAVHDTSVMALYARPLAGRPLHNLIYLESAAVVLSIDGDDLVSLLRTVHTRRYFCRRGSRRVRVTSP
jgi:hypothetical protein